MNLALFIEIGRRDYIQIVTARLYGLWFINLFFYNSLV